MSVVTSTKDQVAVRQLAALVLGRIGGPAAYVLDEALGDKDVETRRLAALGLSAMGPSAMRTDGGLQKALQDSDAEVRKNVAYAFACIGLPDRNAVASLATLAAQDKDLAVREACACAIGYIDLDLEAEAALLIQALHDPHPRVRAAAAFALRHAASRAAPAASALAKALTDPNPEVRAEAASSLGTLGDSGNKETRDAALAALQRACEDTVPHVQFEVRKAMSRIDHSGQADPTRRVASDLWQSLRGNPVGFMDTLRERERPEALAWLLYFFTYHEADVGRLASSMISDMGRSAVLAAPELVELASEDNGWNVDALTVLAHIGVPARMATLDALWIVKRGSRWNAEVAMHVLAAGWPRESLASEWISNALKNIDVDLRISAATRLAQLHASPERTIQLLKDRLNDKPFQHWCDLRVMNDWHNAEVSEEKINRGFEEAGDRYRQALSEALKACEENARPPSSGNTH
jgi:HEAT repeat protein